MQLTKRANWCVRDRARQAVTLAELLVALAIVALLMALMLPAIHKVREATERSIFHCSKQESSSARSTRRETELKHATASQIHIVRIWVM